MALIRDSSPGEKENSIVFVVLFLEPCVLLVVGFMELIILIS